MTIKASTQHPDLTALLASFGELSEAQQDTVAEYFIRRSDEVERRGGMCAVDYLLLIAGYLRGQHRQTFFDAAGRAWLTAWQPDTAQ